jgi:hypothetical protein
MKNLITLTFALLFSAGLAFGQNSATSSQNGTNNVVNVTQNPGKNKAVTSQNGVFNLIKIEQVYEAEGPRYQNVADVSQKGDNNQVARLHQDGSDNEFDVTQNGNGNIVTQHPYQGDSHGYSWIGNIQINQTGNKNKVWDADQAGWENALTVSQNGDNNIVNVEAQVNMNQLTGPNSISIAQKGNGNAVGGYGTNEPGAYQEGKGNYMDIKQSGGASAGVKQYLPSDGHKSYTDYFFRSKEGGQGLIQLGITNSLFIDQKGESVIQTVYQNGKGNQAVINQTGAGNSAASYQTGEDNIVTITQTN